MYKVYFEKSFFEWLDDFIVSMKEYYLQFYSNTWLYNVDKIIEWYFNKYEWLKSDILIEINTICKNWILWRKIQYNYKNIENCSYIFMNWNYQISFTAIKNDNNQEIIVNTIKIEH